MLRSRFLKALTLSLFHNHVLSTHWLKCSMHALLGDGWIAIVVSTSSTARLRNLSWSVAMVLPSSTRVLTSTYSIGCSRPFCVVGYSNPSHNQAVCIGSVGIFSKATAIHPSPNNACILHFNQCVEST